MDIWIVLTLCLLCLVFLLPFINEDVFGYQFLFLCSKTGIAYGKPVFSFLGNLHNCFP